MKQVFIETLRQSAERLNFFLTEKQIEQFSQYYELLIEWNEKINLTALTEPQDVAVKHMIDSLTCYDPVWFNQAAKVIDVGTGAGFPGLPLKIFQPEMDLTLLDALNKRLNFLQSVTAALDLAGVALIHARAEEGGRNSKLRETFDIALSRAVARLSVLTELCLPFVKPGGLFLAMKGAKAQEEVEEAGRAIAILGGEVQEVRPIALPDLADQRYIVAIRKTSATPRAYPRRPGQPEKKPIL